jgi:beta-lactamase regulating signal transducer with metallopeptidase domain
LPDAGLLFTLPAQSVAVRLLVGAVVGVVAARCLLRAGLRVPRVRVAAALVPAGALVAILAVSLGDYRLPTVMVPNDAAASVLVPIENTYAYLAPLALPALVGAWVAVVVARVSWRLHRILRLSSSMRRSVVGATVPVPVQRVVRRVAARMAIDAPPVALAHGCPGGASVVGVRRPTVVLDADLVARLDAQELEGVVAHELAHVRRRDNLVALVLSVFRDVVFFVPGGRWALRQLLVEREMAADHLAVQTTNRPGALAGGLLKVLEGAGGSHACAALLPQGTLVRRVNQLVEEQPAPTRSRVAGELVAIGTAATLVVISATALPRLATGGDPEGGLGVMLSAPQAAQQPAAEAPESDPRVFDTYRRSALRTSAPSSSAATILDDDAELTSRASLAACAAGARTCDRTDRAPTLALRPRSEVRPGDEVVMRWHAHPVVDTGDVLRIYWLSTMQ